MVSSAVIGLYVLLAFYVVASGFTAWAGKKTGWWDLRPDSLAGILLLESTEMRVGPEQLPGFGLTPNPEAKLDSSLYLLGEVGKVLGQIELMDEPDPSNQPQDNESVNTKAQSTPEQLMANLSFAELRLGVETVEELRSAHDQYLTIKDQQNALESASGRLTQIQGDLPEVRARIEQGAGALPGLESRVVDLVVRIDAGESGLDDQLADLEDQAMVTREEIAFSLYDLAEPIVLVLEEVTATGVAHELSTGPMADLVARIQTVAEEIELGEPGDGLGGFDLALLDQLASLIADEPARLGGASDILRSEIIEISNNLFPMPSGFAGAMYRLRLMFGTDRQGRSILIRALYSAKTAVQVGLVTAVVAVVFGSVLGAAGAFFSGWVDHLVIWLYSTFSSIPYLVLLSVIAFVVSSSEWVVPFTQTKVASTLIPLYAAFAMTFWIGPCRVIRGEVMKLKELEFVQAATAIGFSRAYILRKHIIPNTSHLMFINFSLLFIGAIKGEVILTFLGLGLKEGSSWGIMISQARPEVLNGFFWQIGAATFLMFVLVLAFNILTDALQDAFDPKHV